MRLVLVGPPGAGKGTQAQFLSSHLSIPKISTGDIFRDNVSHGTALGRRAQAYMERGDLVPDEITVAMVRDRLAESPFRAEPRGRVVLTGGASQLTGLPELAAQVLGRQVRIGRPLGISGLPDEAKGPAFAVATGLLVYPQAAHLEHFEPRRTRHSAAGGGYIARVGQWLRESF